MLAAKCRLTAAVLSEEAAAIAPPVGHGLIREHLVFRRRAGGELLHNHLDRGEEARRRWGLVAANLKPAMNASTFESA